MPLHMPTTPIHTNHDENDYESHNHHENASERTPLLSLTSSNSSIASISSSSSPTKRTYSVKTSSAASPPTRRRSARTPTSSSSSIPSTSSTPPSSPSSPSSSLRPPPPLPWSQIYIILLLQLCEPLTSHSIYPYIADLVRSLGVTRGDEHKVGFYAGLVESLFFLAEALTVLHWSRLSDRVGRKPVLLVGLAGLGASTLAFGLARTFAGVVVSRCVCGVLNGNIGVMKSVMGELTTPANRAEGFALMPVVWSAGATLGPLIGGGLSRPYDRFPHPSPHSPHSPHSPLQTVLETLQTILETVLGVFHTQFWKEHPYFLPCAAVALLVGAAWAVAALFFRETLNRRPRSSNSTSSLTSSTSTPSALPAQNTELETETETETETQTQTEPESPRTPLSALLTRRTLVPIANYTLLALLSISINALQPLFLSTPSSIPPHPSPFSPSPFAPSPFSPLSAFSSFSPSPLTVPPFSAFNTATTNTNTTPHPPPPHLGIPGLALAPPTIGLILGLFGILNGLFQALYFPAIVQRWGAKKVFRVGVGAAGGVGAGFAGMGLVGGYYVRERLGDIGGGGGGGFGWMVWALVGVQLSLCVLVDMAYGCIFMFITASAPAHALGATNGLAQTAVSVARAVGPVAATSLFSVSLGLRYKYEYEYGHSTARSERADWAVGLLGANMVYIFVVALSGVAVWVGGMLPDTLDEGSEVKDGDGCGEGEEGEEGSKGEEAD
ncbi:MFS transporter superfamily protein [Pleurotus pulmonarius]